MSWILIAVVSGSILTSGHDTEEQCLGRKAILAKTKIVAECVRVPTIFSSSIMLTPHGANNAP